MDYMSYIRAIRSSDLTAPQKITAIMIASHYDFTKGEPAFPSNKLLSQETGLAISTIVRAKNVLSQRGYLYSQRQWDNSCKYTPLLPEVTPSTQREKLNTHINTQLNTNINTHINKKDSNESFEPIINMNQEVVDPIFEVVKEEAPAAAPRPGSQDYYLKLAESLEW